MSNLPLLLSLADDLNRLSLAAPSNNYTDPGYYYRHPFWAISPWERQQLRNQDWESIASPVSAIGKDGFQVCMNVDQFKPNELNVKVVENSVVVEGKHEERADDHGFISRHFVRRYALPDGYEADKVVSTLSSDGVLTVKVPKPAQLEDKSNERVIQIQQVGPAHLNVRENAKAEAIKDTKDKDDKDKAKL